MMIMRMIPLLRYTKKFLKKEVRTKRYQMKQRHVSPHVVVENFDDTESIGSNYPFQDALLRNEMSRLEGITAQA